MVDGEIIDSLEKQTKIFTIKGPKDIPSVKYLRDISINNKILLQFEDEAQSYCESVGQELKESLYGYLVSVHTIEPTIFITKLITDEEIELNADFFEMCAKEHRDLAAELMYGLAGHLKLNIHKDFPSLTFDLLKSKNNGKGNFNGWQYALHGFHCHFKNLKTGQEIEAPTMFGHDFGELDPYFFSLYILSAPQYKPLPFNLHEPFHDGERILDKMLTLGKFERIPSNWPNRYGVVVKDRDKVDVKIFDFNAETEMPQRTKFNLLNFFRFKK